MLKHLISHNGVSIGNRHTLHTRHKVYKNMVLRGSDTCTSTEVVLKYTSLDEGKGITIFYAFSLSSNSPTCYLYDEPFSIETTHKTIFMILVSYHKAY